MLCCHYYKISETNLWFEMEETLASKPCFYSIKQLRGQNRSPSRCQSEAIKSPFQTIWPLAKSDGRDISVECKAMD